MSPASLTSGPLGLTAPLVSGVDVELGAALVGGAALVDGAALSPPPPPPLQAARTAKATTAATRIGLRSTSCSQVGRPSLRSRIRRARSGGPPPSVNAVRRQVNARQNLLGTSRHLRCCRGRTADPRGGGRRGDRAGPLAGPFRSGLHRPLGIDRIRRSAGG